MFKSTYTFFLILLLILPILLADDAEISESKEKKAIDLGEVVVEEEIDIPMRIRKSEVKIDEVVVPVGANPVDVLQTEAGIDVSRRSLFVPKSKMIKLRTFDTEKTLVALDGRTLNGAGVRGGYQVDWGMIQLEDVEKIDVIKGAFSAEYGNTLGGIINIIPKEPEEELHVNFSPAVKEYNSYNIKSLVSKKFDNFGFSVGAGYLESDGFLRNAFAKRTDISPVLYFYLSDEGKLKFSLRFSEGEYGMPIANKKGSPHYDSDYPESEGSRLTGPGFGMKEGKTYGDSSYYWKQRYELDSSFKNNFMGIDLEARLYGNYEDRIDKFYAMDTGSLFLKRRCPSDTSWGCSLKAERQLLEHKLKAGIEGNYMGYEGTEYLSYDMNYLTREPQNSNDQHNLSKINSAFLQDRWNILSSIELYLGLRVDNYKASRDGGPVETIEDTTLSPKFGIYFSPIPEIDGFISAARATKFPIIPKYYWYYAGYQPEKDGIERKELTYEDALQFEIGSSYSLTEKTDVSLKGYYYDVKNYLRWIFGYKPSRVVYNLDAVKITGLETELKTQIYESIYAFANYTLQDTKKEGDILDKSNISDKLGEIPQNKVNLGLQYQTVDGTLAKLTMKWVDERKIPISAARIQEVGVMEPYMLLNALIRYLVLKKRVLLYVGCENILDEEYQETYGYPMPKRMFFGGLRLVY